MSDTESTELIIAAAAQNIWSVDKVIFEIGTGRYQYFVFAITGIIWAADAMEMMLLSFLLPELKVLSSRN